MVGRRVFYSFNYNDDAWRASKIRNIGVVEGNQPIKDNDWESVKKGGDKAIEEWINAQMHGRSCVVVLVGAKTAGRKWIKHEINKAWADGKGLLGIRIHKVTDAGGVQTSAGRNPFEDFTIGSKKLSSIVKLKNPPRSSSAGVYNYIAANIEDWVEEAILIRNSN